MKPIIGLTCSNESLVNRSINKINYTYISAVFESGGIPIVIPILKDKNDVGRYLDIIDGLILTGGGDVSSLFFHEEPIKEVNNICLNRDITEIELFKGAYKQGTPIFGICRGMQLLNIALGGDIYQDIYSQVPNVHGHTCISNVQDGYHTINVLRDSILYDMFKKERLVVNSQHHQAIRKIGENLKIIATTNDGIIEAVESINDKFVFGVQFHPEAMAIKYDEFLKPFNIFTKRCKEKELVL